MTVIKVLCQLRNNVLVLTGLMSLLINYLHSLAYAEYPRYPAGDYIRPDYAAGSYTMAYDRAAGGYQGYGASGYSRGYPS